MCKLIHTELEEWELRKKLKDREKDGGRKKIQARCWVMRGRGKEKERKREREWGIQVYGNIREDRRLIIEVGGSELEEDVLSCEIRCGILCPWAYGCNFHSLGCVEE
jgi:hypothetical protein